MKNKGCFILLSFIFVFGRGIYADEDIPATVKMPSIKDWGIWHTASSGVIQSLNDTENAINNHAEIIGKNINRNKELEEKIEKLRSIVNLNDQVVIEDRAAREKADAELKTAISNETAERNKLSTVVEKNRDRVQKLGKTTEVAIGHLNANAVRIENVEKSMQSELKNIEGKIQGIADNKDLIAANSDLIKANEKAVLNEQNLRAQKDKELSDKILENSKAVSKEQVLREETDKELSDKILENSKAVSNEQTLREETDKKLLSKITNNSKIIYEEQAARKISEDNLTNKIQDNSKVIASAEAKNIEMQKDIEGNSVKIENNRKNIAKIEKLHENSEKIQGTIDNHEARISAHEEELMRTRAKMDDINSRIDRLDSKVNRGMSLMAAMTAIDFQDVRAGEVGIGAGLGHFENSQGVAVGAAYAPTENIRINAKYSVSTDDIKTSAIGIGGIIKFRVR